MIFESHAHYDDRAFDTDRKELLKECSRKGIAYIVNVSASISTIKSTIRLTEQYPFVYGAVGVHPDEVGELNEENFAWMAEQCQREKIVAVGETGLDYYWDREAHEQQKYWFERQLELAKETGLPVIIHSREAGRDTLEIVKNAYTERLKGVIHCFSYSAEMAEEYCRLGFYIGIGGVVTFKNAKRLKETAERIPLNRILLETDCPYLSPEPYRGKRNSSLHLPYVVKALAELKGVEEEEVMRATSENAMNLYFPKGAPQ